jgi:hypothetical protein
MSNSVSNINAIGFEKSIIRTVEQIGGFLRPITRVAKGDLYREKGVYPRVTGGGRPTEITNRAPKSPVSNPAYGNRSVTRKDYHDGHIFDRADLDRAIADPRSEEMDIMMQKFRREEDFLITNKALGVAKGGDLGDTDVDFGEGLTNNNIIPVTLGADSGVTNAGFTYEKLTNLIQSFQKNNVDIQRQRPCIILGPEQLTNMLEQDKFINKDYINQALVSHGWQIPNYMGCDFKINNNVPYMASASTFDIDLVDDIADDTWQDTAGLDIRCCWATVQNAILFEVKPDIMTRVSELAEHSFRPYAYAEMGFGGVRLEEEKVFSIPCDQSPV